MAHTKKVKENRREGYTDTHRGYGYAYILYIIIIFIYIKNNNVTRMNFTHVKFTLRAKQTHSVHVIIMYNLYV